MLGIIWSPHWFWFNAQYLILFIKTHFSDQQDCEWDVLDTNDTNVKGVKAIFRNESRLAEIIGDIDIGDKLYILKGTVYILEQ